jgi:prophage regulatory protein
MEKQPVSIRVLRMKGITEKTGLSESLIHDLVSRGIFLKPFPLVPGGRAVGWLEEDIDTWIRQRKESSQREGS